MQRVDAEARRLTDLGATLTGALNADGLDHYAVGRPLPLVYAGNQYGRDEAGGGEGGGGL